MFVGEEEFKPPGDDPPFLVEVWDPVLAARRVELDPDADAGKAPAKAEWFGFDATNGKLLRCRAGAGGVAV